MIDGAALVSLVLDIGQHDDEHDWYAHPVLDEGNRAGPSIATLATMLDTNADIVGKRGWVIYRDELPLFAVIGNEVHWKRRPLALQSDPRRAVGDLQFLLDAIQHSL